MVKEEENLQYYNELQNYFCLVGQGLECLNPGSQDPSWNLHLRKGQFLISFKNKNEKHQDFQLGPSFQGQPQKATHPKKGNFSWIKKLPANWQLLWRIYGNIMWKTVNPTKHCYGYDYCYDSWDWHVIIFTKLSSSTILSWVLWIRMDFRTEKWDPWLWIRHVQISNHNQRNS